MIIVGGTYSERISFPETNDLFGSGLKAAAALSSLTKVTLHSAVANEELAAAKAVARSFGIDGKFQLRPQQIVFSYITPLAKPMIVGLTDERVTIAATGDVVLAFGMLEAIPSLRARRLIYDPQNPVGASIPSDIKADKLAIVLNAQEARRITALGNLPRAAKLISRNYRAEVVVVKNGAMGAHILENGKSTWVGAHPTKSVWPIGSGDTFSSIFAWAWGERRLSAAMAAKIASAGTSIYCEQQVLPLPKDLMHRAAKLKTPIKVTQKRPKVYLAAPFFSPAEEWMVEVAKAALENLGADVFSPLHDVGHGGDEVATPDLKGLAGCSAMLALLDGDDPGTIFEVGYARANGTRVVGFSTTKEAPKLKMLRGTDVEIHGDLSSAVYRAIWAGLGV